MARDGGASPVDPSDDDIIKIMVATDNHLGVHENDEIRRDDSFEAFEEVFQRALELGADLVLLGGDIFHVNKPSQATMVRTMNILRKYCLSDRPVRFRVANEADVAFSQATGGKANFASPDINVGLPAFTIHGNHDDPVGREATSAIDVLAAAGLVNYFGKHALSGEVYGNLKLAPVVLEKGETRVALYGLGYMRDERLCRMFRTAGAVEWVRPTFELEGGQVVQPHDFFSIFVVHQNRATYGAKNYLPEEYLPDFLDFVVWGHEHECLVEPQRMGNGRRGAARGRGTMVSQPGSSVATTLTEAEAKEKKIMMLEICRESYRTTCFPLEAVRPYVFQSTCLSDVPDIDPEDPATVEAYLERRVEGMIEEARKKARPGDDRLPLVRLRVDHAGFPTINSQQFGARFVDRVANPQDIMLWSKRAAKKAQNEDAAEGGREGDLADLEHILYDMDKLDANQLDQELMEALITRHMKQRLEVLPESELTNAVSKFVDKQETGAIDECVAHVLEQTRRTAREARGGAGDGEDADMAGDDAVAEIVQHAVQARLQAPAGATATATDGTNGVREGAVQEAAPVGFVKRRPQAAPAAPRGAQRKAAGRSKASRRAALSSDDDEVDSDSSEEPPAPRTNPPKRGTQRQGRAAAATARKAIALQDSSGSSDGDAISDEDAAPARGAAGRKSKKAAARGASPADSLEPSQASGRSKRARAPSGDGAAARKQRRTSTAKPPRVQADPIVVTSDDSDEEPGRRTGGGAAVGRAPGSRRRLPASLTQGTAQKDLGALR
ncbi:unnamed protein product [Pedinophyceae sp. YPF-701]|nr:unnamed protein product [Pedinophyceae sp. YPF-701]